VSTLFVERLVRVGIGGKIDPGVQLGVDGFGFSLAEDGAYARKPQHFGVVVGSRVHIGANSVIARGSYRDTTIGDGTKIDALVFVAHNCLIGRNCLLIAHATLCGSVELGEGVLVGAGATIKEHVKVGDRALIGAGAVVLRDVPAGEVWVGNPARKLRDRAPGEMI
jgi:UDP-3-O-[3-hydroxymyristoyl] glucosamine N-acyltransferase